MTDKDYSLAKFMIREYLFDCELPGYTYEKMVEDVHIVRDDWGFGIASGINDSQLPDVWESLKPMINKKLEEK